MLHVLSPAKSLDYQSKLPTEKTTVPDHLDESAKLINKMKKASAKKIKDLMGISDNLVQLNQERYREWKGETSLSENTRQALFAFSGDVYQGLDAYSLKEKDLDYAQGHLRILSGLYGILKPLDLIEPYRLEMGTQLKVGRKNNLYEFWGDKLKKQLIQDLKNQENPVLVNLASNEYFKVIQRINKEVEVINPEFKDAKNGKYKIISFFAKKARGMMSRYIIENKVNTIEGLQGFDYGGYRYRSEMSSPNKPVFTREENQA